MFFALRHAKFMGGDFQSNPWYTLVAVRRALPVHGLAMVQANDKEFYTMNIQTILDIILQLLSVLETIARIFGISLTALFGGGGA